MCQTLLVIINHQTKVICVSCFILVFSQTNNLFNFWKIEFDSLKSSSANVPLEVAEAPVYYVTWLK